MRKFTNHIEFCQSYQWKREIILMVTKFPNYNCFRMRCSGASNGSSGVGGNISAGDDKPLGAGVDFDVASHNLWDAIVLGAFSFSSSCFSV